MASRIRFHWSVIIAPQRAGLLCSQDGAKRNPGGLVDAEIAFPDCAIGRRVAPTRWLHPGYELPRAIDQPRELSTGPIDALRPGGSTTTIAPCLTRSKRSMTSSFVMRMQPDEMAWPIYSGWLVP